MKSHDLTTDRDVKPQAKAIEARLKTQTAGDGLAQPGPAAKRKHQTMIDSSPYVAAQRKRLTDLSGQTLQKQVGPEEEEELMQGKLAAQRQIEDEEELLQGKFAAQMQPEEEEELIQGKFTVQMQAEEEEELMQGKFSAQHASALAGGDKKPLQQKPKGADENLTGMPDRVKTRMEDTFATDFSDVRVHPNSGKASEARALAYTQGSDVHFAPGQFKPESSAGQQLLGHELAHVVQQAQGRVKPTGEVAGLPVNDSPDLENEADRLGEKVIK